MSGDQKTTDEKAYDRLIEELGLDIDLDAPIGDNAPLDDQSDDQADIIADIEPEVVSGATEAEKSAEEEGVELSAELLAELKNVMSGGDEGPGLTDFAVSSDQVDGADVFGEAYPEPPPLAEDPFTVEAGVAETEPEEEFASFSEDDSLLDVEEAGGLGDEAAAVDEPQPLVEAEDDLEVASSDPVDLEPTAVDPDDIEDTAEFSAVIDALIAEQAAQQVPDSSDVEEDETSDRFEDQTSEADSFDLGFDAGVVLREALEERRRGDRPAFDMSSLMEDADEAPETKEASEEHSSDVSDDMSLEDILGQSFGEENEEDDHGTTDSTAEAAFEEDYSKADEGEFEFKVEDRLEGDLQRDALDDVPLDESFDLGTVAKPVRDDDESVDTPDETEFAFSYEQEDGGDRMVPRISLHAFCQTATATQLLTTIQNDRRMANVTMEVHQGGSRTAFEYYAERQTPHLIIIETTGSPVRILAELDELAERCDENVKVIVVGQANDIRLYRELMHRGVSEYIVPPLSPVQVIRSVANLFVDPEQPFTGKSIAVTGVKGGVGSSTIAHNIAWTMSDRMEANTTLVDLDLNFGTTGLDFNQESQQTIADAILSPDRFDEAVLERLLVRASDHLSLFTAPATLDRTFDLEKGVFDQVMSLVRQSVPYVVMDLPHIWSDWFKSAVVGADEIVVVAQPDLASLRNGKNLLDFLKAARPNDAQPRLVINNVGVPRRPEIPVKDFAGAIGVEPELVLPFDPQLFGTAANNGQMISDVAPESKCSQGIDYLAGVLTGRQVQKPESGSLINKLFKR